jgi:hypothetical protein
MIVRKHIKPHTFNDVVYGLYVPNDNSYSLCYENDLRYFLAGNVQKSAEIVNMVSKPYTAEVRFIGITKTEMFVDVKCHRGLKHRVLYYDRCVIKNVFDN